MTAKKTTTYENLFSLFLNHLSGYKKNLGNNRPKELYDPEDYILSLGGKRLRPMLSLIACDLFDGDPKQALNSALCVELFHNFSLMHDDILDEAPLRRNQPTVHTKWNTNIAILSGDVMLVKSYGILEDYPANEFKQLTSLLTKTAIEVCEGQQLDMNFEASNAVTVSDYIDMITKKTAVLLGCSLQMGAINAGAGKEEQNDIYNFGKHLGIAFQLMDDMLDTFSKDAASFGKQVGGDILANKKTYLLLKAFELANEHQKDEIKKLLSNKIPDEKINGMKNIFKALNIEELCLKKADEHTQMAINSLDKMPANETKKAQLKQFALTLLNRQI